MISYANDDHIVDSNKKVTVGSASVALQSKGDQKQSVLDTQKEMMKGYHDELVKCAMRGVELFGKDKPFYLCVQTRRERLLTNVIRNQFYPRQTRPSPEYDLALYHYDPKDECIRFIWCIPNKEAVEDLILHEDEIPADGRQLVHFCKCFKAGTLI